MLSRHDQVPHVVIEALDGRRISYTSFWQRRNLVLLSLPSGAPRDLLSYAADLERTLAALRPSDTEYVVTAQAGDWAPTPGIVIADRWGEVYLATDPADGLPEPEDVLVSVQHMRMACPECEGEAR